MSTLTSDSVSTTSRMSGVHHKRRFKAEPYLFVLPAFIIVILILVYPLSYSFYLSFHHWTMQSFREGVPFIGFANYAQALQDVNFWNALRVTVTFMIGALVLEFALGLGLALLLDRIVIGEKIARSLILLPMMCTNIVIGLIWRMMLNFDFGVFNYFVRQFGFQPVAWLSSPETAMWSLIVVDAWNTTCFVALILLAGLQMQSVEVREAAIIDGANDTQMLRFITLPLLRPSLMVALLWRAIDTFRIFDVVYSLTAGGPGGATQTISLYIHYNGFQRFDMGYTAAVSMLMIAILFVFALLLYWLIGRVAELS